LRKAYSCERRKDYVTYLGVLLFCFIILFELYLVLWVPVQLKSRSVLEKEVAKQEMITLADSLRDEIGDLKTKTRIQDGEVALAKTILDNLAVYIRANQDFLDREQIRDLNKTLQSYDALSKRWKDGRYIVKEERLDYSNYLKALKEKAGLDSSPEGQAKAGN
jgi:hypothetical protein